MPRPVLGAKILLACISLLVAVVVGEVALRALGYYGSRGAKVEKVQLVDDPIVDYRRIPGVSWIHNNLRYDINGHGWRDHDHTFKKPPGTFRILSVGDSVTNGHGVEVDDIYSRQLQLLLAADPPFEASFEVILMSLGALNTEQEVHLAEIEGLRYSPDLIMVGYVLNDPEPGASLRRQQESKEEGGLIAWLKREGQRSSLVHLTYRTGQELAWKVRRALGREEVSNYAMGDHFQQLHANPKSWERVTRGFDRLERVSRETGIPVLVVIFPVLHRLEDYPWAEIHRQVARAATDRGFAVLDLLPALAPYDVNDLQVVEGDHIHPGPTGHRLAAEAIDVFLRQELFAVAF